MNARTVLLGSMIAMAALQAGAQQQQQVAQAGDTRCRKEVKDYMDTLRFVRQTAGAQIGDKVAGGFISEADLDKVVSSQGHCAAAQALREKGIPR